MKSPTNELAFRSLWWFGLVLLISSLHAGCGSDIDENTSVGITAEPAIGPAPATLVEISASVMVPEGSGPATSAVTLGHTATGTPVTVSLQDPSGGGTYQFSTNDSLVFSVGQVVNFTIESETEFHTFTVDELEIDVAADTGETVEFYFEFTEPGRYELVCVPHESQGMRSTITVVE